MDENVIIGKFVDDLVGPLQTNTITSIYGAPGTGKSTLCFEYVSAYLKTGKKIIYVDTEGGFSAERLKQINPEINLNNVIVISPTEYELDVSQYMYEFVVLNVPYSRVHSGEEGSQCDSGAIDKLTELSSKNEEPEIDQRWSALKQLLTDKE